MMQSKDLAARFEAYSDWRRRLSAGISRLHEWLSRTGACRRPGRPHDPAPARAAAPGQAGRRVRRRVLPRQVRADQRDLLRRLRPAPAAVGSRAHDDVSDRAPLRLDAPAVDPPAADRDARARRLGHRVQELRRRVGHDRARPVVGRQDEPGALAGVADQARADRAGAQVRTVRRRRRAGAAVGGRRGGGRHPVLAPRGHQLSASAAAAGAGDTRHAGARTRSAPSPSSRSTCCRTRTRSCSSSPPTPA